MLLKQFYSRGLHLMARQPQQVRMMHNIMRMQQQVINKQIAIVAIQEVSSEESYN